MLGTVTERRPACVVIAAATCVILSACSPGADYPSPFPAVHDMPPPRSDARLDANQVQQATEDLISARDRLSTDAQGTQKSAKPPTNLATAATTKKQPAPKPVNVRQTPGADAGQQQAGTETK